MLIIVTSIIDTKAEQFIENNLRKTQIIVELKVFSFDDRMSCNADYPLVICYV